MTSNQRTFPILDSVHDVLPTLPRSVPWSLVDPHEPQALKNHNQTLKRLAERGGLDWSELADVIEGKSWDGRAFSSKSDPEYVLRLASAAARVLRKVNQHR